MVDKLVNSKANYYRIKRTEECFGTLGKPLLIPGRVLIGEGILFKMCRKGLKERIFFLFNDVLVYGNIIVKRRMYNKQHIIPLEEIKIEPFENNGENENGWFIRTPNKSFAVYSSTAQEKQEWVTFIQRCAEEVLKRNGKKVMGIYAAVWVPDIEAPICMCCGKSEFTVIKRRHHCRNCGRVVCAPCSNRKYLLTTQSSKPVRVCRKCFIKLSNSEPETVYQCNSQPVVSLRKNQTGSSEENSDTDDIINHSRNDKCKSVFYGCSTEETPVYNPDHQEETG